MADVVVTLKIMPTSVEVDLEEVYNKVKEKIVGFSGMENLKKQIEPVAFGLNALKVMFVMSEDKGATDPLEEDILNIQEVESVTVTDVRRSIG
jgi:translation elongation factor aEF-1 beta